MTNACGRTTLPVLAIVAGAAAGLVFVRRQHRLASPLLDLRLFRNRTFSTALGVMLTGAVAMGGMFLFISQYLQLVQGPRCGPGCGWYRRPSG